MEDAAGQPVADDRHTEIGHSGQDIPKASGLTGLQAHGPVKREHAPAVVPGRGKRLEVAGELREGFER